MLDFIWLKWLWLSVLLPYISKALDANHLRTLIIFVNGLFIKMNPDKGIKY